MVSGTLLFEGSLARKGPDRGRKEIPDPPNPDPSSPLKPLEVCHPGYRDKMRLLHLFLGGGQEEAERKALVPSLCPFPLQ